MSAARTQQPVAFYTAPRISSRHAAHLQTGQLWCFSSHEARHSPQKEWPQGANECAATMTSRQTTHSSSLSTTCWLRPLLGPAAPAGADDGACVSTGWALTARRGGGWGGA